MAALGKTGWKHKCNCSLESDQLHNRNLPTIWHGGSMTFVALVAGLSLGALLIFRWSHLVVFLALRLFGSLGLITVAEIRAALAAAETWHKTNMDNN